MHRDFLFLLFWVVCVVGGLLQFTLMGLLGAFVCLVGAALTWRFMLYEVAEYFRVKDLFDS